MTELNERPEAKIFWVVMTAETPISHHDPRVGSGGNQLAFLRQSRVIRLQQPDAPVWQHRIDMLCAANPMPDGVAELLDRFSLAEFAATAFVRLFLDVYNSGEGTGQFSGMTRYEMLDRRIDVGAATASSLHGLWANLLDKLSLPVSPARHDEVLGLFFSLPPTVQYQVLIALASNHASLVAVARLWHTANKGQSEEYAKASGREFAPEEWRTAHFDVRALGDTPRVTRVALPHISANSVRHQVRASAWLDLAERLGLPGEYPGTGELKQGVESLFDNGGNILSGATVPPGGVEHLAAMFLSGGFKDGGSSESSKAFYYAMQIQALYPTLDLLGGVSNAFGLNPSRLRVMTALVCRENQEALPAELADLPEADLGAMEYLDEETHTRQAVMGAGQMIYTGGVLIPGVKLAVRLALVPFTPILTEGALMTAVDYYAARMSYLGGQAARGYGHMALDWVTPPNVAAGAAYRAYVSDNADALRAGLLDGSLGTGAPWVVK